jgi:hypothetical protein
MVGWEHSYITGPLTFAMPLGPKFQIFRAVIVTDTVLMVDRLMGL